MTFAREQYSKIKKKYLIPIIISFFFMNPSMLSWAGEFIEIRSFDEAAFFAESNMTNAPLNINKFYGCFLEQINLKNSSFPPQKGIIYDPVFFYDLKGKPSAYMNQIERNRQYDGYLTFNASKHLLPIIMFSEKTVPLKYNQHYTAKVEAIVTNIYKIQVPTIDTNKAMAQRSAEKTVFMMPVEKIVLKIRSIFCGQELSKNSSDFIKEGNIIEITNPWQDQKPSFKVGDCILAWVQLVSSSETLSQSDKNAQWWFYNPEETYSNSPPRKPFKNIIILPKEGRKC